MNEDLEKLMRTNQALASRYSAMLWHIGEARKLLSEMIEGVKAMAEVSALHAQKESNG